MSRVRARTIARIRARAVAWIRTRTIAGFRAKVCEESTVLVIALLNKCGSGSTQLSYFLARPSMCLVGLGP